jgi:hypothetical protein
MILPDPMPFILLSGKGFDLQKNKITHPPAISTRARANIGQTANTINE